VSWKTDAPSKAQIAYLRDLAQKAGETFAWPATKWAASVELERLERKVNKRV
jgi:hypothetical protein